jgi:2-polyprenyl-3-methyl-5-hydroxy-6-metoxy-1,4-benzoquinol methylase
MSEQHDQDVASAFDKQAARFERAPVQSDPVAIERLVAAAGFPSGGRVLDAGCGPGLVSAALLAAGYSVVGIDLSHEMIERARRRCDPWSDRAEFIQASLYDPALDRLAPFDGALSRYVLHHVVDPSRFVARQLELLRPGGVLVASDHTTDPLPQRAAHHEAIERARDRTHTTNLTAGQIVDLLCRAGLDQITFAEESYVLDFDEWFDRGTPQDSKESVRAMILSGPIIRGFRATLEPGGLIKIDGIRGVARGVKPAREPS